MLPFAHPCLARYASSQRPMMSTMALPMATTSREAVLMRISFGDQLRCVRAAVRLGFLGGALCFLLAAGLSHWPWVSIAVLLAGTLALVLLDVSGGLPFLMAVKPSERVEMSAIYSSFRDVSGIVTPGAAWLVLLVAPVAGVFVACAAGLGVMATVAGRLHPRLGAPRGARPAGKSFGERKSGPRDFSDRKPAGRDFSDRKPRGDRPRGDRARLATPDAVRLPVDVAAVTIDGEPMVRRALRTLQAVPLDPIVVVHGTDTMAYSASALAFLLEGLGKPLILTGSQIPLCEVRNDAVENLVTALLIAGHYPVPEVCLYFGGKLLRGCRSVKVNASGLSAFDSPNYPPLGTAGIDLVMNWSAITPPPGEGIPVRASPNTARRRAPSGWDRGHLGRADGGRFGEPRQGIPHR